MKTTLSVQLLNCEITLLDLDIGQAIDIAQIPQEYNERRISALIGHITDDPKLAASLTVQERYYLLLSHQGVSDHGYNDDSSNQDYLIDTIQSEIPDNYKIGEMHIQHLRGAHACVLEGLCENLFDWLCGQMACQLYGDLRSIVGGSDKNLMWDQVLHTATDNEITKIVTDRYEVIKKLSATSSSAFNELASAYDKGCVQLMHFVEMGCDNEGLTVIKQGGAGTVEPARFLALGHLSGTAARIAECVTKRRDGNGGTRQNEPAGSA